MVSARQAARETRQATEETMRKAAEETHRVAATAADASASAARASAELMQRNVETVQRAWEGAGQTASELAARSMQQLSRAAGLTGESGQRATQESLANYERIVQSGTVVAGAMQSIFRECLEFAQRGMQQNVDGMDRLVGCRTPQELITAQTDLVRSGMEELIQSTRRVAEISLKMANEAAEKMSPSLAPGQ